MFDKLIKFIFGKKLSLSPDEIQKKKLWYQERKSRILSFLKEYHENLDKINEEEHKKWEEEIKVCPICGGSNTIQVVRKDPSKDPYLVRVCKDCENEWIPEDKFYGENSIFSIYNSHYPNYLYCKISDYLKLEYNPLDFRDPYNSLEEKREAFCKELSERLPYKNVPREVLEYLYFKLLQRYKEEPKDLDEFSYVFSDELWEAIKKIIGYEGPIV
jgi:hypothetical protein